jgi:hypothetical protein
MVAAADVAFDGPDKENAIAVLRELVGDDEEGNRLLQNLINSGVKR